MINIVELWLKSKRAINYRSNHSFYEVVDISKLKLLEVDSKLLITFNLIVDGFVEEISNRYIKPPYSLSVTDDELDKLLPVNQNLIIPSVDITEGMLYTLTHQKSYIHYIYDVNGGSFWSIPLGEDPKKYLNKNSYLTRIEINWAYRFFYTGWWIKI